ncbi:MAG: glycine cleavage system aminomethyltransferase GcvT [Deltaproteobacteria bacterium]|nr:glycine cleavage system aminomethyltransferase GcvT [Deltaproteobacteria bacterium]MBI3754989.1 glycine cleavage system aminomethyltransferase GcvT [Deltaproteobacteria bacterium]
MKLENRNLQNTPLHEIHKELNARLVPFAGWEMPVQYAGVIEEHLAVRKTCGLFDVSHMGEIEVSGIKAMEAVQAITTNDAYQLKDGQVQYTFLCYPNGGVVDDATLYKLSDTRYMFCVNASNTEKDFNWIEENAGHVAEVKNVSNYFGQVAIQGPLSEEVLQNTCNLDLSLIRYYHFAEGKVADIDAVVSRTGYTGEDGFEIYMPWDKTADVWQRLMEAGIKFGIKPIGLGARDTLRLEMGFPLYGNELNENTTPLEAGLHKFVKLTKQHFIGKDALVKQVKEGIKKSLVGLEMIESGIPRSHYKILLKDKTIGEITSGTMSPSLDKAIGMGYVETAFSHIGTELGVAIRNKTATARITKIPFYPVRRPQQHHSYMILKD